jgi:hypothetical protein
MSRDKIDVGKNQDTYTLIVKGSITTEVKKNRGKPTRVLKLPTCLVGESYRVQGGAPQLEVGL